MTTKQASAPNAANVILPKVWVTKYALTEGILVYENAEHCVRTSERIIAVKGGYSVQYVSTPFWHTSLDEAQAHAEELRAKKIASMEKQLKKLRTMAISVTSPK